ncbi:MAG: RNA polymerase sigma factor [Acidobacteria bacterium]|nr:RNA polymerase sigma factor [Acidobacteriota bacterium]
MAETDQALASRVRAGDSGAFRHLVERHSRSVFRLAFRMTGSESDADDIVQDTFLRAFRQIETYEARSAFSTWIYRIAANCCLDMLRARRRRPQELPEALVCEAPGPDRMALATEVRTTLSGALATLSDQERAAFLLRHFEGCSISQIGESLGISETAAKNSIFRAVKKLRDQLEGRF